MEKDNGAAYLGIGMVAGLVIGLAVGILYAPKAGPETRDMLKERAYEFKDKAADVAGRVKTRASEMMHRHAGETTEPGSCA